jgi:hypothetical protein
MRVRLLMILFLGLSLLLTGCDSQEEVDEKVLAYLDENFDFEVDIIYRESVNEGNMGDRSYTVETKEEPKVKFSIFLTGMINTEVVGDDYEEQKRSQLVGEKFLKTYKTELSKLKFSNIKFEFYRDFRVKALYNDKISVFHEESTEPIYKLIELLNTFKVNEQLEEDFESLFIDIATQDGSIYLEDIKQFQTKQSLQTTLLKDTHLVVDALLMRDETLFLELGEKLRDIGYDYYYGFNEENQNDHSVFCLEAQLVNGECTGGYRLQLKGESIAKADLFQLTQLLNNTPPLTFNEVSIRANGQNIFFDDVKMIKESSQIDWYLK